MCAKMVRKIRLCAITTSHRTQIKLVMQNMLQYTRHTSHCYQKLTFQNSFHCGLSLKKILVKVITILWNAIRFVVSGFHL